MSHLVHIIILVAIIGLYFFIEYKFRKNSSGCGRCTGCKQERFSSMIFSAPYDECTFQACKSKCGSPPNVNCMRNCAKDPSTHDKCYTPINCGCVDLPGDAYKLCMDDCTPTVPV